MSLLESARNANTEFSEIPIMSVCPSSFQPTLIVLCLRDLKDISDPNPEVQQALAKQIRDACIDVGFFYGTHLTKFKD